MPPFSQAKQMNKTQLNADLEDCSMTPARNNQELVELKSPEQKIKKSPNPQIQQMQ